MTHIRKKGCNEAVCGTPLLAPALEESLSEARARKRVRDAGRFSSAVDDVCFVCLSRARALP